MDLSAPVLDVAPGVRGALLQALERLEQPVTRRTQAAYESADVSRSDAASCVKWAKQLVAAAESRLET